MFYERKVKYLDYLTSQDKCGNAGFVKLEARGDICNIRLNVGNLRTDEFKLLKVYAVAAGQEREMCTLEVSQGKGAKELLSQPLCNLGGTGIAYEQLEAIRIPLGAERELFARMGHVEEPANAKEADSEVIQPAHTMPEKIEKKEAEELIGVSEKECEETWKVQMIDSRSNTDENPEREKEEGIAGNEMKESTVEFVEESTEEAEVPEATVPLCDTKWKQLWQIYPHIRPFCDEREYLSLSPGDFVILSEKYFRMVNNSFLLHGYYNYKHLVLKRIEGRGKIGYYVGVPGNFYDREKQVALMFGFESFESQVEPAGIGDYGYYMMRVEL
uniref:hypothetical protein n=1 Tax=Acetatifactor sp. TaxID=1872090 RepID=UPI0040571349